MGDHFVLLLDQLITDSILEAAIHGQQDATDSVSEDMKDSFSSHSIDMDKDVESSPKKLSECRICHDEDEESSLEMPCSCRGSLKCLQKWCNLKGNIVCEICRETFKPDYKSSPPLFRCSGIPVNIRGNWAIRRRDGSYMELDIDNYPVPTSRKLMFCRMVVVMFLVLILSHTLPFPFIIYSARKYRISLLMLLLLLPIGILLLIILKSFTAFLRRQNRLNLL